MSEKIRHSKQEYEPPKLLKHGTVKDLTLDSVSGGGTDSGYTA
ncbi:lasso RiPP family leader peptide-containing protein [Aphanizomenon sp. CS-733/32]|nr:lasso RiPP family leader peptide-containing protein [Aphanizomenon sp. CS-733/32]MDB9310668.1 lasso RiPP family leader peptide-containing protein [Aphanizomenon sp. CS-733/32]